MFSGKIVILQCQSNREKPMSDFEHNDNKEDNLSVLQKGVLSQNDELVVEYKETADLLQDAFSSLTKQGKSPIAP